MIDTLPVKLHPSSPGLSAEPVINNGPEEEEEEEEESKSGSSSSVETGVLL